MISLELCEISLVFREIKTTTAKNPTNVLWVTKIFIIFEAVFVYWFFKLQKCRLIKAVCGLDVHKDSIFLCILHSDGELFEQVFGVLTFQLEKCRKLLQKHRVSEVCMESTSIYWIPIWRVLSPHFTLRLVNPYFIKQLPGHKSDVKDAQWIAECTMKDLVRGSFVPPEIIQQLRQYDRRIFDLNVEIVRKVSKVDGVLQRCNIRLSNYVSNIECKSYRDVVRRLSEGVTNPNELMKLVHGRIVNRHGAETILASLTGVVSQAEIDVLRQLHANNGWPWYTFHDKAIIFVMGLDLVCKLT